MTVITIVITIVITTIALTIATNDDNEQHYQISNSTENGQGSSLNFTKLSQSINSISYLLPVKLPPFYTLIIRTLTILEGTLYVLSSAY